MLKMNIKNFINVLIILVIVLVIVLAGNFGIFHSDKKSTLPPGKHTIYLETIPIAFELPKGYAAFQQEHTEGDYKITISIGKELRSGYLKYAPFKIEFLFSYNDEPYVWDPYVINSENYKWDGKEPLYHPSEYVEVVFKDKEKFEEAEPKYVQLFGNKAVQYTYTDGCLAIIGYLRADQSPKLSNEFLTTLKKLLIGSKEYYVKITSDAYGTGEVFDKKLFDTIVNSLRIIE